MHKRVLVPLFFLDENKCLRQRHLFIWWIRKGGQGKSLFIGLASLGLKVFGSFGIWVPIGKGAAVVPFLIFLAFMSPKTFLILAKERREGLVCGREVVANKQCWKATLWEWFLWKVFVVVVIFKGVCRSYY